MIRTAVNITGDAAITVIAARSENSIDMEVFNDPDAGSVEDVKLPAKAI
jgi:Na+/H+-dicarboxylate symporter